MVTTKMLEDFSMDHYTYINQIFGDQTLRKFIAEMPKNRFSNLFPGSKPFPRVEYGIVTTEGFESEDHHVVDLGKDGTWCSVDSDTFQDITINKNDTLCQSYSLLKSFGGLEGYVADAGNAEQHKEIQLRMIALYTRIINVKPPSGRSPTLFKKWLEKYDLSEWDNNDNEPLSRMKPDEIIRNIKRVLDEWNDYGYYYFIGDGQPLKGKPKSASRKNKKRRVDARTN